MESAAAFGDWKCRAKYSVATAPSESSSFCGEEVYSVQGSSIAQSKTSTTRRACLDDITCSIGLCDKLCSTGYGKISGHRLTFIPSNVFLSEGIPLSVQTIATSCFIKTPGITSNADDSLSAFKYSQVLNDGNNGPNWLWHDFEKGAWQVGTGMETNTGLLLQLVTSSLLADEKEDASDVWEVWDGSAWLRLPPPLRLITIGIQRECASIPKIEQNRKLVLCESSADCGYGGSCSGFKSCSEADGKKMDGSKMDGSNFSSPVWLMSPIVRKTPALIAPTADAAAATDGELGALKYTRFCEQRQRSLSLASPLPFDSSDSSLQAEDVFKALQADSDLQTCIWIKCRQTEMNPGAFFLKSSLVPDNLCQSQCKKEWCKWAGEALEGGHGYLGCSITHLSTDCKKDSTGANLTWILPVAVGCVALVLSGILAMGFFGLGHFRRDVARYYQQRRETKELARLEAIETSKLLEEKMERHRQESLANSLKVVDGEKVVVLVSKSDAAHDVRSEAAKGMMLIMAARKNDQNRFPSGERGGPVHATSSSCNIAVWEQHKTQTLLDEALSI